MHKTTQSFFFFQVFRNVNSHSTICEKHWRGLQHCWLCKHREWLCVSMEDLSMEVKDDFFLLILKPSFHISCCLLFVKNTIQSYYPVQRESDRQQQGPHCQISCEFSRRERCFSFPLRDVFLMKCSLHVYSSLISSIGLWCGYFTWLAIISHSGGAFVSVVKGNLGLESLLR